MFTVVADPFGDDNRGDRQAECWRPKALAHDGDRRITKVTLGVG